MRTLEDQLKEIFQEKVVHSQARQEEIKETRKRAYLSKQNMTLDTRNSWVSIYINENHKEKLDSIYQRELDKVQKQHPNEELCQKDQENAMRAALEEMAAPEIKKLKGIYGEEGNIPTIYSTYGDATISKKQAQLLYLTNQQILDLQLSEVENFDACQLHILIQRLQQIDEAGNLKLEDSPKDTVGWFRAMRDVKAIVQQIEMDSFWGGFLSVDQVVFLFENHEVLHKIPKRFNWFHAILPITWDTEINYTQIKLARLCTQQNVLRLLNLFPPSHIALMPDSFFCESGWEWTAERIQKILINGNLPLPIIERFIQSFKIEIIKTHVEIFTTDHFRAFKAAQLKEAEFPWVAFSQKLGWGRMAREKIKLQEKGCLSKEDPIAINPIRLPWQEMNREAIKDFFALEKGECQELKGLTIDTIIHLSGIWELGHLQHFSNKQRNDPYFPWTVFIKEGIGKALYNIYEKASGLAEISLPWDQLSEIELGSLLTTEHLLSGFSVRQINHFAHVFDVHHLKLIQGLWRQQDFKWEPFIDKEGIGAFLYENRADVIEIQDHIPWEHLPSTQIEFLFLNIFGTNPQQGSSNAINFFQKLKISTIVKLSPYLSADFITIHRPHLADPQFPWQEFIKKPGIGAAIRKVNCVYPSVPWGELAKNDTEMQDMLAEIQIGELSKAIKSPDPEKKIAYFLEGLDCTILSIIHAHIPALYLQYFDVSNQLIKEGFPWKEFVTKKDIAEGLRSLFKKFDKPHSPGYYNNFAGWFALLIPWSEMEVKEFGSLFCDRHPNKLKQLLMQNIPLDEFRKMVNQFGVDVFNQIVNYSENSYERVKAQWFRPGQLKLISAPPEKG